MQRNRKSDGNNNGQPPDKRRRIHSGGTREAGRVPSTGAGDGPDDGDWEEDTSWTIDDFNDIDLIIANSQMPRDEDASTCDPESASAACNDSVLNADDPSPARPSTGGSYTRYRPQSTSRASASVTQSTSRALVSVPQSTSKAPAAAVPPGLPSRTPPSVPQQLASRPPAPIAQGLTSKSSAPASPRSKNGVKPAAGHVASMSSTALSRSMQATTLSQTTPHMAGSVRQPSATASKTGAVDMQVNTCGQF
jgi:hypothetical protein